MMTMMMGGSMQGMNKRHSNEHDDDNKEISQTKVCSGDDRSDDDDNGNDGDGKDNK